MSLPYEFDAESVIAAGRSSREAVEEMKEWLSTTSLPELQDESVVLFLISCKNQVEAAKRTVEAFFRIKAAAPDIFNGRDVDEDEALNKAVTKTVICSSIPARMDETAVHYFRLRDYGYHNFDLVASMKLSFMLIDVSQRRNPPEDIVVILDMKGVGFMHLTKFQVGAVKKYLEFLQEAMPLRMRMIHILNANYIFDKILAIARAFIKSELMAILKTHPPDMDMEEFFKKYVPASCLPRDYGGELPTSEELNERTVKEFRELKPFFEAEEKMRSLVRNN